MLTTKRITEALRQLLSDPEVAKKYALAALKHASRGSGAHIEKINERLPVEQGSQLPVPANVSAQSAADGADPNVGNQRAKRGRKSLSESQAAGIRTRLVAWKETPEAQRVSLRAFAVELGTSQEKHT
jgi:hypothetical protein